MNAVQEALSFYSPRHLTDMSRKVFEIMQRDGHITRLTATHYNIGDVRREVSRLRRAGPIGHTIETIRTRKDAEGNQYTRWVLKSNARRAGVGYVNTQGECRMAA